MIFVLEQEIVAVVVELPQTPEDDLRSVRAMNGRQMS